MSRSRNHQTKKRPSISQSTMIEIYPSSIPGEWYYSVLAYFGKKFNAGRYRSSSAALMDATRLAYNISSDAPRVRVYRTLDDYNNNDLTRI